MSFGLVRLNVRNGSGAEIGLYPETKPYREMEQERVQARNCLKSRTGRCVLTEFGDPFFANGLNQIAKVRDRSELERKVGGVHIVLV